MADPNALPNSLRALKPFLQRAAEFEGKQPLVAYFLRTYVVQQGVATKPPDDKEATKYLMGLLSKLEGDKAANPEIGTADGRTVLTKTAFALFARADDLERSEQISDVVVKLFYTASQLLEATKQFTDGALDPVAGEKYKYARYMAAHVKKALDSGQPYVSPNRAQEGQPSDAPQFGVPGDATGNTGGHSTYLPPPPAPSLPLPSLTPSAFVAHETGAPAYTYSTNNPPSPGSPLPPPPAYPPPPTMPPPAPTPMNPGYGFLTQPVAPAQQQPYRPPPQHAAPAPPTAAPPSHAPMYAQPPPAASTRAATEINMDAILEAQKYAKQAVSALQFYDVENARMQLRRALQLLE